MGSRYIRLIGLFLALSMGCLACANMQRGQSTEPPTIWMDGYIANMNRGDKYLPMEKFRVEYDCTVPTERTVEARGRKEVLSEVKPLGWEVNLLDPKKNKAISFRLYISNPAKIIHRVTYYQKVEGKIVQQCQEQPDSIADHKNHYCSFPVLDEGKTVEFGAVIELIDEKKIVFDKVIADGFRYLTIKK
jgi:hypothetical protein